MAQYRRSHRCGRRKGGSGRHRFPRWSLGSRYQQAGKRDYRQDEGALHQHALNPTGWTATRDNLRDVLALARKHDLWIVADEIYALYHYAGSRAPSFLDVMEPDDKIVFANSFSKNWSMTGWRVGWLVAPPAIGQVIENLIQYSTSGVAQFMQRGAVAALDHGDGFIRELRTRFDLPRHSL